MRERDHHPVVDFLVFGTALVLAGVLAYYSWQRFGPRRPQAPASYYSSQSQLQTQGEPDQSAADAEAAAAAEAAGVSPTVSAVGRIPPVEGTPGKPKRRR